MIRFRVFAGQAGRVLMMITIVCLCALSGCKSERHDNVSVHPGKLQVITTLFPLYDFARTIGGDRAEVVLLTPPGVDPHGYEPRPNDIVKIGTSGLFVYTNRIMEPWAAKIIRAVGKDGPHVVDACNGITLMPAADDDGDGHHHPGNLDPHVWLDLGQDQMIVDAILAGFILEDPANAAVYRNNAAALKAALAALDKRFSDDLASCATRAVLHGGHSTFGYLARRYRLRYHSLSGVSSESEPSATRMAAMVSQIKNSGVHYLFAEELLSPRLTETLASEAGVQVLKLYGAHNLARDDFERGVTFIGLMERNLANLRKGMACR